MSSLIHHLNSALALDARKQWLADHLQVSGKLTLDDGAVVALLDSNGHDIARGLVNYSADEARLIAKKPSSEIEAILGYIDEPELIHRDNLVLL